MGTTEVIRSLAFITACVILALGTSGLSARAGAPGALDPTPSPTASEAASPMPQSPVPSAFPSASPSASPDVAPATDADHQQFRAGFKTGFMNACTASSSTRQAICECVEARIEAGYTDSQLGELVSDKTAELKVLAVEVQACRNTGVKVPGPPGTPAIVTPTHEQFRAALRKSFLEACTSNGGPTSYCGCVDELIESAYTDEQLRR